MDVNGLDDVIRRANAAGADGWKQALAGLYEEGELVMGESKPLVPRDTSVLVNSGFVNEPTVSRGVAEVVMGYGGPASDYAIVQHEDLTLNHPNGGQAKYLEQPLLAAVPGLGQRIADRIRF